MNCAFLVLSGFCGQGCGVGVRAVKQVSKQGAREEVRGRAASALASFGRYYFEQGVRVDLANLVRSTTGPHQITEV